MIVANTVLDVDDVDLICRTAGLSADPDGLTWRGPRDEPYVAALVVRGRLVVVEAAAGDDLIEIYPGDSTQELCRLHDYRGVMREVSSAYDQVTGGRFSKPNTAARYVADAVEERTQDAIADELRDVVEDLVTVREQCREDGEVLRAVGLGDAIDEIRNRLADRPADVPAPGQDGGA